MDVRSEDVFGRGDLHSLIRVAEYRSDTAEDVGCHSCVPEIYGGRLKAGRYVFLRNHRPNVGFDLRLGCRRSRKNVVGDAYGNADQHHHNDRITRLTSLLQLVTVAFVSIFHL